MLQHIAPPRLGNSVTYLDLLIICSVELWLIWSPGRVGKLEGLGGGRYRISAMKQNANTNA